MWMSLGFHGRYHRPPLGRRSRGPIHTVRKRYAAAVNRFLASRGAVIGALLVLAVIAIAVLSPWLGGDRANVLDVEHGLTSFGGPLSPGEHGPLGTDHLGRDVCARLVSGAGAPL